MRKIRVKKTGTFLGNPEYEAFYPLAGKSGITANGRTPAEAANIQLELGRQKLLTLINHQGKKTYHSIK